MITKQQALRFKKLMKINPKSKKLDNIDLEMIIKFSKSKAKRKIALAELKRRYGG